MFKDGYLEFQNMLQELIMLRDYNLSQNTPKFIFAEAVLLNVSFERLLRIIPEVSKLLNKDATLQNILQDILRFKILKFPGFKDAQDLMEKINRNSILHGNFEQLAKKSDLSTVEYFNSNLFRENINLSFNLLNDVINQVNVITGEILTDKKCVNIIMVNILGFLNSGSVIVSKRYFDSLVRFWNADYFKQKKNKDLQQLFNNFHNLYDNYIFSDLNQTNLVKSMNALIRGLADIQ